MYVQEIRKTIIVKREAERDIKSNKTPILNLNGDKRTPIEWSVVYT